MIVCQRFLKTFGTFRYSLYLKPALCNLEKHCFSYRKWSSFGVSRQNMSFYGDNQISRQADIEFPLNNDMFLLGELDRFLLGYKDTLYQKTEDRNVKELKECQLASDILKIIDQIQSPTTEHLVQAVLTLRGLQKFLESCQESTCSDFLLKFLDFKAALKSSSFENLVKSIVSHTSQMNLEELACCILYLHRFDVPKETLKILINSFENIVKNSEDTDITESALARVCIVLRDFNDLSSFHLLNDILLIIFRKLDFYSDFETLGKITVCFQKMVPIMGIDALKRFIEKSRMVLQRSQDPEIESSRARSVLKIVLLLCFKTWQGQFASYERELLMSLSGSVKYLSAVEIAVLYDVALENMECSPLVHEIDQIINDWLSNPTGQNDSRRLFVMSLFPKMKYSNQIPEEMLKFYSEKPLCSNELYSDMNNFYYWLFTTDYSLLKEGSNVYWKRVLDYFFNFSSLISIDRLTWITLRYLNYHQARNYYSGSFEKQMCEYLMRIFFGDKNSILAPKDYVRLGLMIAFLQPSLTNITNPIWDRIVDNMSRLNVSENMSTSFILKLVLNRLQRTDRFSKFLPHYMNMLAALNNNSFEHLSCARNLNFETLNEILRAFQYREVVKTSPLFDLICDRLKEVPLESMDAKYIRDYVYNMSHCSHIDPQVTDTVIAHVIAEKETLQFGLLNILLNYTFTFGYTSENCEEFVDVMKKMILRYKNDSSGNAILRTALALCYYHALPVELTDYIFNVQFFNQLDREIQTSFNKNFVKYVRHNLMELNRAVCLDYPERDIPWFHEKYCQEIKALQRRAEDHFFDDVSQKLKEIIPTKNSVELHCVSPYYHKIDFLIHTNRKGEPVDPESCALSNLRKAAILLARTSSSSTYYKGKGKNEMLIRQLELLDYKVIVIDRKIWNAMYMSEPFAKENYLCSLIWPR